MPFEELKNAAKMYRGALLLDDLFPRKIRHSLRELFGIVTVLFFVPLLIGIFFNLTLFPRSDTLIQGLFYISLAFWLDLLLFEAFYNSFYYKDVESSFAERGGRHATLPVTFAAAGILHRTNTDDVTLGFLHSSYGESIMLRLGLDGAAVRHFIDSRKNRIPSSKIFFPGSGCVTAASYGCAIFKADPEFAQFLFALSIQEADFSGALEWEERIETSAKRKARFWSKDNLGRIPGIGKTWSYGQIFTLKKYADEFEFGISPDEAGIEKEEGELEAVLARSESANALIVAETGSQELDLVYGLAYKIQSGTTLPQLEIKRIFRINGSQLIDAYGSKASFETEFIKVLSEAVSAGNIILVFDDLPGFMESARGIGSEISSLLYPYLTGNSIQIIGIADTTRFHQEIEGNTALMSTFEIVKLQQKDEHSLIPLLENEVARIERQTGLFFTYEAIEAIAESAARFFTEGVAIDKARDLLLEIPSVLKRANRSMVMKYDVFALVETKTGVPQEGVLKADEKDKLINLETLLHGKIVGQDEAVNAIANAMRRSRAGLRNPNRPIGSFLFLGPTGVGKTETAKALSNVFFGNSAPMLRLDMSEYSESDAITRLIGSFETGQSGTLATMLRDQKYGVLLLDEFEKTTPQVMDLFLSILDEGVFSDMHGKKINARNVIVIATSNAGSDAIFKLVEQGKNLEVEKKAFIDSLIESHTFKPELINRFDGVILFHPLKQDQLKEIAKLVAGKLSAQLKTQGIDLRINEDLLNFLSKEGFDPKFGARPMQRVLEEQVEKLLADKLIRGDIRKGASIELTRATGSLESLEVKIVNG